MPNEFDQLRRIAREADLIAAIVDLDGEFARRLEREMALYAAIAGRSATFAGQTRHLRLVPELDGLFDAVVAAELRAVLDLTQAHPTFAKLTPGELQLARLKALAMLELETVDHGRNQATVIGHQTSPSSTTLKSALLGGGMVRSL